MSPWPLLVAAGILSVERICYVWAWHRPDAFRRFCAKPLIADLGQPVDVLCKLFYGFKCLQTTVFVGWCYIYGHGSLVSSAQRAGSLGLGVALMVIGQLLNVSVFRRLGKIGVFYGNKFGHSIPWCDAFPFSLLSHPQYVGAGLTIWGFFIVARFPEDDWYVLPLLQTGYYLLGAYLEQPGRGDLAQTVLSSRPVALLISRVADLNHRHNSFRSRMG